MAATSRRSARARPKPPPSAEDDHADGRIPRIPGRGKGGSHSLRLMDVNIKVLLGLGSFAFLVAVLVVYYYVYGGGGAGGVEGLRVVTPFPAPKLMDLPQFQGEHKESLYWGTYRPHVYLGIRARVPQSLIAGLMWIGLKNGQYHLRHVCQDSDDLRTYGWTHHNGQDYGQQVIIDEGLYLTTRFLKAKMDGSGYGGDWAVRIDMRKNDDSLLDEQIWKTGHLFFYLADEEGSELSIKARDGPFVRDNTLLVSGSRQDIGGWELHLDSLDDLDLHSVGFRSHHMHNLTELVLGTLGVHARRTGRLQLPDVAEHSSNIVVFQISGELPFGLDVAFVSGTGLRSSNVLERVNSLTGERLHKELNQKQKDFEEKYVRCFNLEGKEHSNSTLVGMTAIGNLLGGIGYFYGQSRIAVQTDSRVENGRQFLSYWPAELFTAVPSRSFFPRGFLWDEGFHQLLIWRWDIDICLDIIGHWLDLMNTDGWIPREQILGAEALSKVPAEFVIQHPTNGNPPTLFLALRDIIQGMKYDMFTVAENERISSFLGRAFSRLDAWFKWFNTTQAGKQESSFYWHGRDKLTNRELNPKTLSSGLDDYPRASHPSDDERHLDLRCWMLLAASCMNSITELLQIRNDMDMGYYTLAKQLSDFELLNKMHLHDVTGTYFDYGNHTEKVHLRWHEVQGSGSTSRELIREASEHPHLKLVPHIGYVSLFPFMMRIIPSESWVLEKQLDLISNKSILWTSYGLRSLSKTSSLFMKHNTEHDPPYWRGPIWINMNYMILSSLHHYSQEEGPYKQKARAIYVELRKNLIRNIVKNYFGNGYLWEQYEERNKGKGKGARPFTGWTSLVLLIMAEAY